MSGNQETRVRPAALQCFHMDADIPIKKRRYLVRPSSPPSGEASPALSENCPQPNDQVGTSNAMSVSCSLNGNEEVLPRHKRGFSAATTEVDKKIVDQPNVYDKEPLSSVQSVSMANAEKRKKDVESKSSDILVSSLEAETKLENTVSIVRGIPDQCKVKPEEQDPPVLSISLAGIETEKQAVDPSSSFIPGCSFQFPSLAKSPNKELVEADSPSLVLSSEKIEKEPAQPFLTMHDIIEEARHKKSVQGECQTKVSSGLEIADLALGSKTSNSLYQTNEELLSLNLSLSKGDCFSRNTYDISIGKHAGVDNGINRSNWDLNTPMDAWVHGTGVGKPHLALLSNSISPHDLKASSSHDKTFNAGSFSGEQQKENIGFRSDVLTSMGFDHQDNQGCRLSLGLSSYCLTEEPRCLSASVNQGGASPTSFSMPLMRAENASSVTLRIVKSEPLDEIVRQGTGDGKDCPMILPTNRVKQKLVERCHNDASSSSGGFSESMNPTSIKTEPNNGAQSEITETLNQPDKLMLQSNKAQDLPIYSMSDNKDKMPYPIGSGRAPMFLTDMTINPCDLNFSEFSVHLNAAESVGSAHVKSCKVLMHAEAEMISTSLSHENNNLDVSGMTVASFTEDKTIDDHTTFRSRELPTDSERKEVSSLIDDEKINLFGDMLEDYFYGSDFESDGDHYLSKVEKKQDGGINGHERGNVQASAAVCTEENSITMKGETEPSNCVSSETKNVGPYGYGSQNSIHVEEKGNGSKGHVKADNDHIKECTSASSENQHCDDNDSCLMETIDVPSSKGEIKRLIPELQRGAHNGIGRKEEQTIEGRENSSDQSIHTSQGISSTSTVSSGNFHKPEAVEKCSSPSYKAEISTGSDDVPMEISGGGNHSRIINLARVSSKSPVKTPDASGGYRQSQMGREKLPDVPLEAGSFLPQGRDEAFMDESYKFSRERYHGLFIRNPRTNLWTGRRRFPDRTESCLSDRDSENFGFNNFGNTRQDGAFVRSFHRGKRPLNDDTTFFSHSFPRRRPFGYSFTNRGPEKSDNGFAFYGHRDGEKYMRGLPRNNMDPVFRRPQHTHEDFDGHIVQGQNFSSNFHRRGPLFHSRSPNRSKAHSLGHRSSFRSRSPDGFDGHPGSPHRISPPGYRMERMRSPDHLGFPRDMIVRRHGSPLYSSRPSNVLSDKGSGRGRGYRRSSIYLGNQPDRFSFRPRGKFNILDNRERVGHSDDFFEGPMHSGRFGEFGVDGNTKRRRFGGRRETFYSSRPSFNSDDCVPSNVEIEPEAMGFGEEDDAEIDEQGNFSGFDRQNENHNGDAPLRARRSGEKGENSRQGEEIWHGNEFDDEQAKVLKRT